MKNKEKTITLMCGLPRAGKSTWIKKNKKNNIIVSPDEIRKEIFGHQFHAEANKFVFAIAEAMTILLLKQGESVIVDATHMSETVRVAWLPVARKYNAHVKIVWVYASKDKEKNLKECLKRNAQSPDGERLPEDVLVRMSAFFEEPDGTHGFSSRKSFELVEYRNI